jgi:hypothetical protein
MFRNTMPTSPAFQGAMRRTVSNGEGRFEFKNLAAGSYYLRTSVTWEIPSRYGTEPQGGLVGGQFLLEDGEHEDVILSTVL